MPKIVPISKSTNKDKDKDKTRSHEKKLDKLKNEY